MRIIRELAGYARPFKLALGLGVLAAVVEVAAGLAQPWPLQYIVDRVVGTDATAGGSASQSTVLLACVTALLGIVTIGALADYWSTRLLSSAGLWIGTDLRGDVFAHLHRLSLGFHSRRQVGDLSARVTADVDRTQDLLVQSLAVLGPSALVIVGMFTVMVILDPVLTIVALVVSPILVVAVVRSTAALRTTSRRARKADGQVAAAATESLGAMAVVQAFTLEGRQRRQFAELNAVSLIEGLEAARLQARFSPMVDITSAISTAAVLWVGTQRVLDGRLSLGVLLVFVSYLGSLYKPVKAIAKLAGTVGKGTAAAERVVELLSEQPEVVEGVWARPAPALSGAIRYQNVSFGYGREQVLDHFDLHIAPGETVALVGRTGAGKSTVAGLLGRFMDPQHGAVLMDGIDLRELTLASLRSQISYVLQDTLLLRGTIRDNIAAGRPGASEREVLRATRLALVDEFTGRLPLGLDTPIGERGADLSGGQRQRIAIARAILRDAPILVLDEPTSALDPASEQQVIAALGQLPSGRTRLVIAHRLSTIRAVDRICVIDAGRVREAGSHDQLLAAGGAYAAMHRPVPAPLAGVGGLR